jgi:hypothetical protein
VELRMSEAEAHRHLQRLIEFVNAYLSKAIQGQLLEEDWHTFEQAINYTKILTLNGLTDNC